MCTVFGRYAHFFYLTCGNQEKNVSLHQERHINTMFDQKRYYYVTLVFCVVLFIVDNQYFTLNFFAYRTKMKYDKR